MFLGDFRFDRSKNLQSHPLGGRTFFRDFFFETVMCRKTMHIKKELIKSDCLRRIVSPRFGLRLLRDTMHQNEAVRHWRSNVVKSTIRKHIHREKKRGKLAKLAQNAKEERKEEIHRLREDNSGAALLHLPPPGAMAPANTTQYLMGQFYEDMPRHNGKVSSFSTCLQQCEAHGSPLNVDTTVDSYDACLSFQQRDFEEQFGALW